MYFWAALRPVSASQLCLVLDEGVIVNRNPPKAAAVVAGAMMEASLPRQ